MKKLLKHVNSCLLLMLIAAGILIQQSCKKDTSSSTGTPVITGIRNYVAHPGDSALTKVGTGLWVVISGRNLKGALQINFDGVAGSFNDAWFSDTSAIVLIPAVIAFPSVPAKQLNTVQYITTHGQTTFSFPIIAPAPQITSISDEDAPAGDSVKIYGFNFFFIKSVTFGGKVITSYTSSNDGTSITLAVPSGIPQTGGLVSVTTNSGSAATIYNVEDFVDGVFQNWDSINGYPWGSNTDNSSTDYPGNTGSYNVITATSLAGGDFNWYNGGRGVNMGASQWVPVANIDSSLSSYAVKFEVSVPKSTPWTGGSIFISVNYSFTYIARYRPWANSNGTTTPFTTTGWVTVTVPLSSFLTNNGTGIPVASITDLVGSSGNNGMNIWYINDGTTSVAAFTMAIDNIRVVKIQ
ncbi:glycan-binding surface protein [Mucilaginibacter sp. L196]|uniref:glycan-binding surface protein n=1 Tax=Mucilaginibacter sp. L196 TaxID=1641870 RepID=UPI00131B2024|nr:glycan-binding surface protein [Mucilaginibacter sp. L196]